MSVATLKKPATNPNEPLQNRLRVLSQKLTSHQLSWASGYFAGLAEQHGVDKSPGLTEPESAVSWSIFYATETGNCRAIAQQLAAEMAEKGITANTIDLIDFPVNRLKKETYALFILATHGIGEAPEGTEEFFEGLFDGQPGDLSDLKYSILALGDSSYIDFCEMGRKVDKRLEALGAQRLSERVECDLDFDDQVLAWNATQLEISARHISIDEQDHPLNLVPSNAESESNLTSPAYSRLHPFPATLVNLQKITGARSSKTVYHIVLEAEGLEYNPGDSLGVWPQNPTRLVDPLIELLQLNSEQQVHLGEEVMSLRTALTEKLEITLLGRSFLSAYADKFDIEFLQSLTAINARKAYENFVVTHQVIDVFTQFPRTLSAQTLVELLRKLSPRLYSIASSMQANPGEVHLTVSEVFYNAWDNLHYGSTTSYLSEERLLDGQTIAVYVAPNSRFALPSDPATPIIMIGTGTGVAPYRAFLQARKASGASGNNWLIFGDRNFHSDFLYQIEWARYRKSGLLTRHDVAFSRDQTDKIYVQDRIRENAVEVRRWLRQGAIIYVCGDAQHMAPDVEAAFLDVLAEAADGELTGAVKEIARLKKVGRYLQDVY